MRPNPGGPGRNADAGGLAIIAALRSEALLLDRMNPVGCHLVRSGPGPDAARAAAEMARAAGAGRLLSWGLAAGLDAAAATGTIVVPRRIVTVEAAPIDTARDWCAKLTAMLADVGTVLGGDLAGVDSVLTAAAAKAALAHRVGAVAADMESHAIADVAARAGLPFAAVRVVVDRVDDDLPADVATYVDATGAARPLRAFVSMLRSPTTLRQIVALGRQSARAHAVLGRAAERLGPDGFGVPARGDGE